MKGTKFLLAFWLATATFCLLQILFGPGGLIETERLREQNARLETRLVALKDDNARLTARYEALRTSPEAVRLEARALGYFRSDEIPVRTLDGTELRLPSEEPDLSTVPPLPPAADQSSWFFRIAMPLLFLVYYALFHLYARLWPTSAQQPGVRPEVRQNLPAVRSAG